MGKEKGKPLGTSKTKKDYEVYEPQKKNKEIDPYKLQEYIKKKKLK